MPDLTPRELRIIKLASEAIAEAADQSSCSDTTGFLIACPGMENINCPDCIEPHFTRRFLESEKEEKL